MTTGFSDKARKSASLARKIKVRFGQQAYLRYKMHGIIPAGLDTKGPKTAASPAHYYQAISTPKVASPPKPATGPKTPDVSFDIKNQKLGNILDKVEIRGSTAASAVIQKAASTINKVMKVPSAMPRIEGKATSGERKVGGFRWLYRPDGLAVAKQITTSNRSAAMLLTALHEFGHFIDTSAFGPQYRKPGDKFWPSISSPLLANWRTAVAESNSMKKLKELSTTSDTTNIRVSGGRTLRVGPDRKYIRYLMSDRETFARSFAQYIAEKSQDKQALDDVQYYINRSKENPVLNAPNHWEGEDFFFIREAFDELFKELGWLKN